MIVFAYIPGFEQKISWKQTIARSRPRFWMYLLGPFMIGAGVHHETIARFFHDPMSLVFLLIPLAGLFVYFTLPANLLIYGVNDIFDYNTDLLNAKKDGYESVLPKTMYGHLILRMILLHLIFFPVFVLILIFQQIFVPVSISLAIFWFLGIQYSAKPIRAKAIPFIDMLFNALYVMPGVVGYMYFSTLVEVGPHFYYAVAAGILWCMAMHAYSAVPDISADKQAGIRTTATVLGKKYTLLLCTCLYLVSTLLAASILGGYALLGGAVYIGMMLYSLIEQTNETKLFRLYTWFPYVNMIMGAGLFFWTILH